MADERIKVVVHHTGHFVTQDNGNLKFDGEIAEWPRDLDLWSYFGILASVKALGHIEIKEIWYSLGGQTVVPDRLELLIDDRGVMHMLNIERLNDEVHLYVVHNTMEPDIIEMIDWIDGDVNDEVHIARQVEEGKGDGDDDFGDGDDEQVGREIEEGEGEVQPEVGTQMEELVEKWRRVRVRVRLKLEHKWRRVLDSRKKKKKEEKKSLCTAQRQKLALSAMIRGRATVWRPGGEAERPERLEANCSVDIEVAKQIENGDDGEVHDVEEEEVHDVEEVEVHDVHDFELQDDEGGHDGDDDAGDDVDDEDEDVGDGEYENVDDSVSEESLVDVRVECDTRTSKGQPCSLVGECSRTTDNDSMHDVRGLSDIEMGLKMEGLRLKKDEEKKSLGTAQHPKSNAGRPNARGSHCLAPRRQTAGRRNSPPGGGTIKGKLSGDKNVAPGGFLLGLGLNSLMLLSYK
ncbi:hypothetical protein V8G54_036162 [Vigna mungo]|uniref:PB1-like domain-containing protein n=1 Tax=Vigna mungo TaxID=3915 RepID=A0AAQ3RCA6_VIGMU